LKPKCAGKPAKSRKSWGTPLVTPSRIGGGEQAGDQGCLLQI
jgi:hypothetical protein